MASAKVPLPSSSAVIDGIRVPGGGVIARAYVCAALLLWHIAAHRSGQYSPTPSLPQRLLRHFPACLPAGKARQSQMVVN